MKFICKSDYWWRGGHLLSKDEVYIGKYETNICTGKISHIWMVYNPNGDSDNSGIRFSLKRTNDEIIDFFWLLFHITIRIKKDQIK